MGASCKARLNNGHRAVSKVPMQVCVNALHCNVPYAIIHKNILQHETATIWLRAGFELDSPGRQTGLRKQDDV